MQYRKWEKGLLRPDGKPGFETPSGKFEIASTILEEHGYDPLPVYTEPQESPLSQPELAKKFPLVFNSGARVTTDFHAQHHGIESLLKERPEPTVTINVSDARARGIKNGDLVHIKTSRGQITLRAVVTDSIVKGAVEANMGGGCHVGPKAWQEGNINELTDLQQYDPISGFPVYKALLCDVHKKIEKNRKVTMEHQQSFKSSRLEIRNYLTDSFSNEMSKDIFTGLTADQKFIPSKYFYDERGSILYKQICKLPEYYQTCTELSILEDASAVIMEPFESGDLVELGSGANWKICKLMDAAKEPHGENMRYVPVDVSESALVAASVDLINKYQKLKVLGIIADYTRHMNVIPSDFSRLIIFLGSSIGNFSEEASQIFLRTVANSMKPGDRFLIGLDMIKQKTILEAAYNDSQGVTSEFNKNVLHVINRESNADFDVSAFDHVAFYNEEKEQVEIHLQANQRTSVEIKDLNLSVPFEEGETIHTEICRKFSKESAIKMFSEAGLSVEQWFTDPKGWVSLLELVKSRV